MESEPKAATDQETDQSQESSNPTDLLCRPNTSDRKDEDEEEEEEEEEDKIVEKSHNSRFHKRNKRFPNQIEGVDSAFVAIEPKSGKEVIWNECVLSEKKSEKEQSRYLSIIKKLKRNSHPFLARFLDAWIAKSDDGSRKLVFIIERLDECTLKQFLCNSLKNNRLWKRHVGQLLSVLMFLHRLGIAHGNLTKETIYYQNSGNLRVGPFALGGCLDQKSQSADVYALGVVALEIAVWTPTDFPHALSTAELCQEMLGRLERSDQRSFIEMCLDLSLAAGHRIKRLINHPAVTEVPTLKLLSAMVIVRTMRSMTNEEGAATEQTGFATLLKEYLNHYEDETVIVEVHFAHDNIVNSRSWKDFRSNFTLTSKFLDDVKNGFYPFYGCRWNWATFQDEEEESLSAYPGHPMNGAAGASASSTGPLGRVESNALLSQAQSSIASTVPSANVSRKQSAATNKTSDPTTGSRIPIEDEDEEDVVGEGHSIQSVPERSSSLCDRVQHGLLTIATGPGRQSEPCGSDNSLFIASTRAISKEDGLCNASTAATDLAGHVISGPENIPPLTQAPQSHSLSPGVHLSASPSSVALRQPDHRTTSLETTRASTTKSDVPDLTGAALVTDENNKFHDVGDQKDEYARHAIGSAALTQTPVVATDQTGQSGLTHKSVDVPDLHCVKPSDAESQLPQGHRVPAIDTTVNLKDSSKLAVMEDKVSSVVPAIDKSDVAEHQFKPANDGEVKNEEREDEEDEEDDNDDDDDDDEDDEDDENHMGDAMERFEPQTVHVSAPDRAPTTPALFTHCQYFYIGAGRWHVYVQMWFVEDRLKRETYVQVFDYEWHDCERVADLFEASRCLNSVDRPNLVRLLALARHNYALVDGELQFPGPLNHRPSHFDALELHEKLAVLRLHQQAHEQLQREAEAQENNAVTADNTREPSVSTSGVDTRQPGSVPTEKDCVHDHFDADARPPLVSDDMVACADHVAQLQEQQQQQQQQSVRAGTESAPIKEVHTSTVGRPRAELPGSNGTLFLDVGGLAPRNDYCALCDTHDYLHRVDLPPYLISPCYHCRETLAREAKISPEVLLDLHLQHSIPWPAFLQARYNLPADGRLIEDLIAYDCRWRSRQPCRCLLPSGGPLLPPCVEFPWLYPTVHTVSCIGSAPVINTDQSIITGTLDADKECTSVMNSVVAVSMPVGTDVTAAHPTVENRSRLNDLKSSTPPHVPPHPNESTVSAPALSLHVNIKGTLPCSSRHPRGAPMTCCHGIRFPRLGEAPCSTSTSAPNQTPPITSSEACPAAPGTTTALVTNLGSAPNPSNSTAVLTNGNA
ncbi:Nuclear receptor binding protein [Paragonimus kellicotti]|nr:Nuclear receptor binding protein [Paragonimus kellicotti]